MRAFRAALAEGDSFTPAQNANLLSEPDILKDFERMWANGLMRAAENKDAVGTVSEMENVENVTEKPEHWLEKEETLVTKLNAIKTGKIEFDKGYVSIGTIPPIYTELFDVGNLNLVIEPRHTFNILNTKEEAKQLGLYRKKRNDHYHNLSPVELYEDIKSLEKPLAIFDDWRESKESGKKVKKPRIKLFLRLEE